MDHNPRVIELDPLSDTAAAGVRRALRLDGIGTDEDRLLRTEAPAFGVTVCDGAPAPPGGAALTVVADRDAMMRFAAALESKGGRQLGAAIRGVLAAYDRVAFSLVFADGERIDLSMATRVMGILNVTPDSFSDGGALASPERAAEAAARMADDGADWIDVGGESTRPGASAVSEDEEIRRVVPVVRQIKRLTRARVSIDTMKSGVARRALEVGADLVNDVSAFSDPEMLAVVRDARVPVIVMHMRGKPRTMQQDTEYVDLLSSVVGFLRERVEKAVAAGIPGDRILVDPGLGFGKSAAGNLEILRGLPTLRSVGQPFVVGASRKSFIGAALDLAVNDRLEGSLAVAALAAWRGAHVIRAHDVAATKRTTRMIDAIRRT